MVDDNKNSSNKNRRMRNKNGGFNRHNSKDCIAKLKDNFEEQRKSGNLGGRMGGVLAECEVNGSRQRKLCLTVQNPRNEFLTPLGGETDEFLAMGFTVGNGVPGMVKLAEEMRVKDQMKGKDNNGNDRIHKKETIVRSNLIGTANPKLGFEETSVETRGKKYQKKLCGENVVFKFTRPTGWEENTKVGGKAHFVEHYEKYEPESDSESSDSDSDSDSD